METLTLVLLSIGGRGGPQEGHREDVPDAREAVLGLREQGNTVAVLAQVRKLRSI
jgi:hypothetical protein